MTDREDFLCGRDKNGNPVRPGYNQIQPGELESMRASVMQAQQAMLGFAPGYGGHPMNKHQTAKAYVEAADLDTLLSMAALIPAELEKRRTTARVHIERIDGALCPPPSDAPFAPDDDTDFLCRSCRKL